MSLIYLALGSNLGDRRASLEQARELLRPLANGPIHSAPIYESDPLDCPPDSPLFLNTVVAFESSTSAQDLLTATQAIEAKLGRQSEQNRTTNAPRPIDIDILLFSQDVIDSPSLQVPHPRLHQRLFVLYPLRDLAPSLIPPTHANPVAILLELVESSELPPIQVICEW